ncbi:MAG: 30S ribosomal protein S28e [Candidatus Micrarchaeia archaeon]
MPEEKPAQSQQNQSTQQSQEFKGYLAEIVDVDRKHKTGIYGEIYTVSCKVLEGRDKGRVIRRNMLGPVKPKDVVRLVDTSREAREIKVK